MPKPTKIRKTEFDLVKNGRSVGFQDRENLSVTVLVFPLVSFKFLTFQSCANHVFAIMFSRAQRDCKTEIKTVIEVFINPESRPKFGLICFWDPDCCLGWTFLFNLAPTFFCSPKAPNILFYNDFTNCYVPLTSSSWQNDSLCSPSHI
jgi:hypothetical protein